MDSFKQTTSIDYEEALDMLLKTMEKSEVFQLRRHISKLGILVGGILFLMNIISMGYIISLKTEVAAIKEIDSVNQQLLVTETTQEPAPVEEEIEPPAAVIELPQELLDEEAKELKMQEYVIALTEVMSRQECTETWFKEYLDLTTEYEDVIDMPDQLADVFNNNEIALIYSCVETEVHGGDFASKVNVANVIFNRLDSGKWGDTVHSVIQAPNQFSYNKSVAQDSTKLAAQYAYLFADTTQGALYFNRGNASTPENQGYEYIFTDDAGHSFFKNKDQTNYNSNEIDTDDLSDDNSVG